MKKNSAKPKETEKSENLNPENLSFDEVMKRLLKVPHKLKDDKKSAKKK